jgi:pteridine reductase
MKPEAVLITGGNRRLGFEMAKKALGLGYSAILHYHSETTPASNWFLRRPELKRRVFFIGADLPEHAEILIERAAKLPVSLAGLVNNASSFTRGNLSDFGHFRSTLELNLMAPLRLCNAFRKKVKKGWIINITDAHIARPSRTFQNYRLSKLFLTEITVQLAYLYAPRIRVNAIAPGALLPAKARGEQFRRAAAQIPLRRTGDTGSLGRAFEYLATNRYVTGQVLYVDGGWHLV